MRYGPKRPSKRYNRVLSAFYNGEVPDAKDLIPPKPRGRQPEADTNDAIGAWRKLKKGLLLERNKRRLATPVGYHQPIMLGWLVDGSPDWIGYQSTIITPGMIGRRIAIFVGIEAKSKDGVVSDEQEGFLNAARDAGAIVGVARTAEEAEGILERWKR